MSEIWVISRWGGRPIYARPSQPRTGAISPRARPAGPRPEAGTTTKEGGGSRSVRRRAPSRCTRQSREEAGTGAEAEIIRALRQSPRDRGATSKFLVHVSARGRPSKARVLYVDPARRPGSGRTRALTRPSSANRSPNPEWSSTGKCCRTFGSRARRRVRRERRKATRQPSSRESRGAGRRRRRLDAISPSRLMLPPGSQRSKNSLSGSAGRRPGNQGLPIDDGPDVVPADKF